jgi:flavin reductase (DIM6/NTAB) family NADH-FMN oxidoreductase RutF
MKILNLSKAFTFIEPGPVILLTTHDGQQDNIMTITWSMVLSFSPTFAICTGPWNHSYVALRKTRECVLAVPGADLLDVAIKIGTCSGKNTDKFEKFGLKRVSARQIRPPLIQQCLGNIECRVSEIIGRHNIIILEGVAAYADRTRADQRMIHAQGDGTFVIDGMTHDRRAMMGSKLPKGV